MKLVGAPENFTDQEREGLSEAELAVLDGADEEDTEALKDIADDGVDDETDDTDGTATDPEAKAAAEKAAAEKAAAEKAAAEKAASEKAASEAKAKREAELAKLSKEDREKAEAADKAKAEADAKADAERKAKEEADAKAAAEAKAKAEAAARVEDDAEPFIPRYVAPMPENYEARVKALDDRRAAATAKMKAGGELEAMLAEHEAVDKERRELEAAKTKHDISVEQKSQAEEQRWHWEVRRFKREVKKHEGVDYNASAGLHAALDAEVKALANDDANEGKDGQWFLTEAHRRVKAAMGIKDKPVDDKAEAARKAAEDKAKKDAEEKAKKDAIAKRKSGEKPPATLGGLPSAGNVDLGSDGEGEFAEANALLEKDPLALEAYIAGKSAEWQERWARHSG